MYDTLVLILFFAITHITTEHVEHDDIVLLTEQLKVAKDEYAWVQEICRGKD